MQAIKILGNTYPHRHRIRAAGGFYSHDLSGHIIPTSAASTLSDIIEQHGKEQVEVSDTFFQPLEGEALREYRTQRNLRRADRLEQRADSARRQAAKHELKPHERDFLRLCEPVKVGHHSEVRHRKLLDRAHRSFENQMLLESKASRLDARAEALRSTPARIKGDAAREDEKIREWHRANTRVGSFVNYLGSVHEVLKVNKVSLKLKGRFGDFIAPMTICRPAPAPAVDPATNEKPE